MPYEIVIDGIIGTGEGQFSAAYVRSMLPPDGQPIEVKFHSEGGSVFEGFQIANEFRNYLGPKKAVVSSTAFSIASYMLTAFDDVEIVPNGYVMIHEPRIDEGGTADELANKAKTTADLRTEMIAAYAQRTGKSTEEVAAVMARETFMNATDAIAFGIVDRVTSTPVVGRVVASASTLPHGVYTALFGTGSGGNEPANTKEPPMADSTPVAATLPEIKAAFPKAKSDFIIKCLERSLPLASVAAAAAEELMTENEEMKAKLVAMEEELTALRAKAAEVPAEEQKPAEEEAKAAATAKRTGVTPVAKATTGKPSARAQWSELLDTKIATGLTRGDAIMAIERQSPGLRAAMLAEANAR